MNSGDVHRHQAHSPLAQQVGGRAHSGAACGWYTAPPAPPAGPAPAAPCAPQRAKRQHPPPHHLQTANSGSNNGSAAPLSPTASHNQPATHNSCAMSSSVRVQSAPTGAPPMHASQHTNQPTPGHFRASGVAKSGGELLLTACGTPAPSWLANLSTMPWHHGAISRERAEQLLSTSQDGVFLIRESTNFPGDHTLCVRFRGHVEHYRIKWAPPSGGPNQRLTIDDEEYFYNMTDLIDHYLMDADGLCTRLVRCLPKQPPATSGGGAATQLALPAYSATGLPSQPQRAPTHAPTQPAPFPPSRPPNNQHNYSADQTDSTDNKKDAFARAGWIIEECNLEIRENIGKGEFGDVMLGILHGKQKVAVKILKDQDAASKFQAEARLMTSLQNDNLVRLLGVVFTRGGSTCIVTEHMAQGSLLDYLRSRGRHYVTQKHQINFAHDACCGMEYLEGRRVVHRDLAARNVLIAWDGTAKVADFGLARPNTESRNLDDPHAQAKLPIKWTAPEALKNNMFSNKSDMWSFGILLWEIYSFGRVPYPRISLNEVVKAVEDGHRMDQPEGCPPEVYDLMLLAWSADPANRPNFCLVQKRLLTMREATPAVCVPQLPV